MAQADDSYKLGREYASSARLNLQYLFWKEQQGFLLHPSIVADGEGSIHIVDIGTGTGIWAIDVALSLGERAQVEGHDISLAQTPPKEWLPSNVLMRQCDIYQPLPIYMIDAYDIVAIRNFNVVVKGDPTEVLEQAWKMLSKLCPDEDNFDVATLTAWVVEPGGWLQRGESDLTTFCIEKICPDNAAPGYDKYIEVISCFMISDHLKWIASLSEIITKRGFGNVQEHRSKTPQHRLLYEQHSHFMAFEELLPRFFQGEELKERQDMLKRASAEASKGAAFNHERVTVVGRKPM